MLSRAVTSIRNAGAARLFMAGFLLIIFIIGGLKGLPIPTLISNALTRAGMNGLLVLAMVPSIQAGLGLNFGLPVGIICGLLGLVLAFEWDLVGFAGFAVAASIACLAGSAAGYLYGCLLNRVKGQEMMVGTYLGFSAVAGMCMFWIMAPFRNPKMVFVIGGKGLRVTFSIEENFGHVLDNFLRVNVGGVAIPTGLLGFFAIACVLVWVFQRTPQGIAVRIAGGNPAFAAACGINCGRARVTGAIMSTVLGAVGIVVYAQSFGFIQIYNAPLMMAFPAVAAILIGGASTRRATVLHAVIGAFLFQALLATSLPVAQTLVEGDMSEVARMVISNGMILYALTRGREEP